jgi:hypothetical protein
MFISNHRSFDFFVVQTKFFHNKNTKLMMIKIDRRNKFVNRKKHSDESILKKINFLDKKNKIYLRLYYYYLKELKELFVHFVILVLELRTN